MENLRPMVEAGPSLDVRLWRSDDRRSALKLLLPLRAAFTLERRTRQAGGTFSPSLNLDVGKVAGTGWNLGLVAGPVFGSRDQHRYYYGVDAEDATPARPAYSARGGYAGSQFLLSLSRRFGRAWVGAYGRCDTLRGAAFEDSPLYRRDYYASGGFAAAWILGQSEKRVEQPGP
jgi:outer membrane scaffolding protein for murein synthesis (MipA/OmpV family)